MSQDFLSAHSEPLPEWLTAKPRRFSVPVLLPQAHALPFAQLHWEDFERLVLRLAKREPGVVECRIYGTRGQKQHGIDLLLLHDSGHVSCVQCKRVAVSSAKDVRKAIARFEKGKWADRAKSFVLCTTSALESTSVVDAIDEARQTLYLRGVEFAVWDATQSGGLNDKLKALPDIVEDFFGRKWREHFNGADLVSDTAVAETAAVAGTLWQRAGVQARARSNLGPLEELDRADLRARLDEALAGAQGCPIVLHGEEGTGKSTVLSSWVQSLDPNEAWILWATAAECVDHAGSFEQLKAWLLSARLKVSRDEAIGLQERCAARPADLLIIDGLNERREAGVWAKLLHAAGASRETQLVVVTRTEHLDEMRPALMGEEPEAQGLLMRDVVVTDFTEAQVRQLLAGLGDTIDSVPPYLRRPRSLQMAARHLGRLRSLSTVTYATLQLLDIESRSTSPQHFFDDLNAVVAEEAGRSGASPDMTSYFEQLAQAQAQPGVFRLDSWFAQDDNRAWLVIGLWLRSQLMKNPELDVEAYVELVETELGSAQFDARSAILEYATTAALLDDHSPSALRLALMDRWLNCQNRLHSPLPVLGKLIAVAPEEVLDGIERVLAADREVSLTVEVLDEALQGASKRTVLRRLSTWLGSVPAKRQRAGQQADSELSPMVHTAGQRGWPVTLTAGHASSARTVALHLALAHPGLFDRGALTSAIASVALNGGYVDDELLAWVLRRDLRDHRGVFDQLASQAVGQEELLLGLRWSQWSAHPSAALQAQLQVNDGRSWSIWYKSLAKQALNPNWSPAPDDPDVQKMASAGERVFTTEHRGRSSFELAFDDLQAFLALHRPALLESILADLVQACVNSTFRNPPALRWLENLSPLLAPADVARLRHRMRALAIGVSDDERAWHEGAELAQAVLPHLSRWRQLMLLARFLPEQSVTAELVRMLAPDTDQAAYLVRRLQREGESRRIAFILRHSPHLGAEVAEAVRSWFGGVDTQGLSDYVRENLLFLAWRTGADDFIKRETDQGTNEAHRMSEELRSFQVASESPTAIEHVVLNASPNHWALWRGPGTHRHLATHALSQALAFITGIQPSLEFVVEDLVRCATVADPDAPARLRRSLSERLCELRASSVWQFHFTGRGFKRWLIQMPDCLDAWLEASDETLLRCRDVFSALVDAAKAARHPRAFESAARRWRLEQRAQSYRLKGYLRVSVASAFAFAPADAQGLWQAMLAEVRDDAELARVVTAALKGAGRSWLAEVIDHDRASAHAFARARAEVIAALAGLPTYRVRAAGEDHGWVKASLAFATSLEQSRDWTETWYRRFRLTERVSTMVGSWLNLIALADVHFMEVLHNRHLQYSEAARFHERTRWPELKRAVEKRQEAWAKTLLGVPLPSGNVGWLSVTQRRV
jgi:hypothetical protein